MEFLHASVALLASMVLVLAGMVGWLYWQQTRLFQNMNSIIMVISDIARTQQPEPEPEEEPVQKATIPTVPDEEDDRVSVDKTPEVVEGPPEPFDTDGLEQKTKKELQEILTKRGIPYSKSDGKTALLSLIKATV
jgi:hypothetical protein